MILLILEYALNSDIGPNLSRYELVLWLFSVEAFLKLKDFSSFVFLNYSQLLVKIMLRSHVALKFFKRVDHKCLEHVNHKGKLTVKAVEII